MRPEAYPVPLGWGGRAQFDFSKEFNDPIEAKNVAMQDKLRSQQRYEQTIIVQKAELAKKKRNQLKLWSFRRTLYGVI